MKKESKFIKIDQNYAAVLNRLTVLKLIIERKNIKRAEVSRLTHLQTSTLTYIIQDLKDLNLVNEAIADDRTSSKGVKPNVITLNEEDNFVVGFGLKPKEIHVVVKSLADKVIYKEKYKVLFDKATIVDEIAKIYSLIQKKYKGKQILGVGLGVPGVIDKERDNINISNLLLVDNFPIGELLGKKINTVVCVENDANAASYAEYILKYKEETENLFLMLFYLVDCKNIKDIGVGSGLIINRNIYYGDYYAAGEIGDIFADILKGLSNELDSEISSESLVDLMKLPLKKDDKQFKLFLKLGRRLGEVISNVVNIINPSVVVIAGDNVFEEANLLSAIKEGIKNNLVSFIRDKVRIEKSEYREYDVAIGAACIVTKKILSLKYFKQMLSKFN